MKVVILAAGKGTRMLPLTEDIPKVLVEVAGKPFLYYVLKNLQKAGFTDLGIVVGYKKEQVQKFLEDNNIKATLIEQAERLGTGHALLQAREFCGENNFIVLGGDNLLSVEDFQAMDKDDDFNYICAVEVEDTSKYGVLIKEGDFLKEIIEKPPESESKLINSSMFKLTPEIWSALDKVQPSPRGEIELTDAVTMLAKEGKVRVVKAKWWLDLGSKEDIPKIEKFLKENSLSP